MLIDFPSVLVRELKAMLAVASRDETRYGLNGILVHFEKPLIKLVATDGRRLAVFDTGWRWPEEEPAPANFIIPAALIKAIPAWRVCRLTFDGAQVNFTDDTLHLTSRAIEGNYPKWQEVVPANPPTEFPSRKVTLNSDFLVQLIALTTALCGKTQGVTILGGPKDIDPIVLKSRGLLCVLMPMRTE